MIVPDSYRLLEEPYHINTYALIRKSGHYNIIALGTPIDARIWDAELMGMLRLRLLNCLFQ